MLASENLLNALSENEENYKNRNNDHDFGKVLELYGDTVSSNREVMCSDGQKRNLLLND